jgi:anti-anti-sigma factor
MARVYPAAGEGRDARPVRERPLWTPPPGLDSIVPRGTTNVTGPDFDLTTEHDADGGLRVRLRGELDLATAGRLQAVLAEPAAPSVVVDLRGLTFMDSTGVRVLLQASEDASRAGWRLGFVMPRDGEVRTTLSETGIDALLPRADGSEPGAAA